MIIQRFKYFGHFLIDLFLTSIRLIWGMWKLTRLPQPAITVFGGARVKLDSDYAITTIRLTKKLAAEGFSIITGGGPGIMEAANFGAYEYLRECKDTHRHLQQAACKPIMTAGIGVVRLNRDKENGYVQEYITMQHFFSRKWLLVRYSVGFVVLPGGFGTLDELFEIVTLRQVKKMQNAPIILFDSYYWQPIIDWAKTRAMPNGLVSQEDLNLLTVTDDVDEVIHILKTRCAMIK